MSIVLLGSTSGSCTLQEQAVAGTTTLTLPTFNGTVGLLVSGTVNGGAANPLSGGTSVDFTGIPAGVRRITVMFDAVSTNGTSVIQAQLGDAGGIETTGYTASGGFIQQASTFAGVANSTAGFPIQSGTAPAASSISGSMVITNLNGNTWTSISTMTTQASPAVIVIGAGSKTLSAALDRVRITTTGGTDTFDAGSINILYE